MARRKKSAKAKAPKRGAAHVALVQPPATRASTRPVAPKNVTVQDWSIAELLGRAGGAYTSAVLNIGPDELCELVEMQRRNRKLSQTRVRQYTDDILAGDWATVTGENAFIIDWDGFIHAGHHRLEAFSRAFAASPKLAAWKIPSEVKVNVDPGTRRYTNVGKEMTPADAIDLSDRSDEIESSSKRFAAAGKIIYTAERLKAPGDVRQCRYHKDLAKRRNAAELVDLYGDVLDDSIVFMRSVRDRHARKAVLPAFHAAVTMKYGREMADRFIEDILDGADGGACKSALDNMKSLGTHSDGRNLAAFNILRHVFSSYWSLGKKLTMFRGSTRWEDWGKW